MKKKFFLLFLSLILVFGLTACGAKKDEAKNKLGKKNEGGVISGSFGDTLKNGRSLKCTFSSIENGVKIDGTTYISKNKMRNDTVMTSKGVETKTHMITNGDYTYYWESGIGASKKGTKMSADKSGNNFANMDTLSDEEFKVEIAKMMDEDLGDDFECKPWKVDNSLLTPPSDISFDDYSKKMDDMHKQIKEDNERFKRGEPAEPIEPTEEMCSFCDMAPDPAGCRKTINCK